MKITAVEPIGITPALASQLGADFARRGHEFVCFPDRNENPEILAERMADADIVIISNIKLGAEVLCRCPKLKMLAVAFTGLDHIDMAYCQSHDIVVKNAAGYATVAVAELAIGLMIDVYRHITALDADTRNCLNRRNFLGREYQAKLSASWVQVLSVVKPRNCCSASAAKSWHGAAPAMRNWKTTASTMWNWTS